MSRLETKGELAKKGGFYCCLEWKITDFYLQSPPVNEEWHSPTFQQPDDSSWSFLLYPNGESSHNSEGWIGLYLRNQSLKTTAYKVAVLLGIKTNKSNGELCIRKGIHDFAKSSSAGFSKLLTRDALIGQENTLMTDDAVTFYCEMHTVEEDNQQPGTLINLQEVREENEELDVDEIDAINREKFCSLIQDFSNLFTKKENTDITLKIGENEFRAHKCILAARCEVFASMFRHDMEENRSGEVIIEDCNPDAFRSFLHYLYTTKLGVVSTEEIIHLYSIADKYHVNLLRKECLTIMANNPSVESFCDVFVLALKYEEKELIQILEKFFVSNAKKILITVNWQSFHKENTDVANELFIKFAENFT